MVMVEASPVPEVFDRGFAGCVASQVLRDYNNDDALRAYWPVDLHKVPGT